MSTNINPNIRETNKVYSGMWEEIVLAEVNPVKAVFHCTIARLLIPLCKRMYNLHLPGAVFVEASAFAHSMKYLLHSGLFAEVMKNYDPESEEMARFRKEYQMESRKKERAFLQAIQMYETDLHALNRNERFILFENFYDNQLPDMKFVEKMHHKYDIPVRKISDEWVNSIGD